MEHREMVQLVVTVLFSVRWELKHIVSMMMILTHRVIRIIIAKSKQKFMVLRSFHLTDEITDTLVDVEDITSAKKATRGTLRETKSTKKNLNNHHHLHHNSNHCNIHHHQKLVLLQ